MTNAEILTKAIQKAIDGGWPWELNPKEKPSDIWIMVIPKPLRRGMRGFYFNHEMDAPLIIYRHDFAKALWGNNRVITKRITNPFDADEEIAVVTAEAWKHHLQQMVIAEDPIKYLEANI